MPIRQLLLLDESVVAMSVENHKVIQQPIHPASQSVPFALLEDWVTQTVLRLVHSWLMQGNVL